MEIRHDEEKHSPQTCKYLWSAWIWLTRNSRREVYVSRSLYGFGDASGYGGYGVGAVVYAVVKQESRITQRLAAAKARLAKQGLTIPRLVY